MAYQIGTATSAGVGGLAHYDLLDKIKTFASTDAGLVASGQAWTVLRYNTGVAERELILQGPGLSGTEQIFVGFKTYQDAPTDYYNMLVQTFKGYVAGNTFETQPGASPQSGVPLHNLNIAYWLAVNGQRIALAAKVGTPVYTSCYVGKMFPYASPGQFPLPLICAGMLVGRPATRFSDPSYSMPYKGNRDNMIASLNSGIWTSGNNILGCWPWVGPWSGSIGPTGNSPTYVLDPVILMDNTNIYGELDGIFHITGFNNAVENTLAFGGKNYVVIQDVGRTGFADYYALELS
jgi:hypothetical protein